MGHGHGHHHHHHHHHGSKNILIAFFLNFTFAIIEFIGGFLTNSVAIYSDALHDLGDSLALLFAYFAEKFGEKEPDEKYTYGYKRFSVLSALINGIILISGSLFVIMESIERISSPQPVEPKGMLLLALLGVAVNGFAAFRLSKDEGINQRMVMLHLLEDILGWIAVLIVSIILLFKPWYILDSILSILISIVILRGVYKNFMSIGQIFLQSFPESIDIKTILTKIRGLDLVIDVHCLKGWSIDESHATLSLHVVVPDNKTIKELDELKILIKKILEDSNIKYSSIEFESESYNCPE
jgi:cobalt-zinc-cadmium efflux system protein